MEYQYRRTFLVNKILYEFLVTKNNEIIFAAIGGNLPKEDPLEGRFSTFDEVPHITHLLKSTKSARKVFLKVVEHLIDFTYSFAPDFFFFTSSEAKRTKTYKNLVQQIAKKTNYCYAGDTGDIFTFVKQNKTGENT